MTQINWGILSTGTIAKKFATTLSKLTDCGTLLAVASRSQESARQFAANYNIPRAYGNYLELVRDPDIDVIYIGTPHSSHYENAKLCLENGKHVLCEKSFTVNASQATDLIQLAKKKNLFLMEAFWTKFLPAYQLLSKTIAEGAIGDITHFRAQYGFAPTGARYVRKCDPLLAGGALLDIGVYALGVAAMLLGYQPTHLCSSAIMGEYGTDKFNSIMLSYESGITAHLITTFCSIIEPQAVVFGTNGQIILPSFSALQGFIVEKGDGTHYTVDSPFEINGFEYQIRETIACLQAQKTESSIMTHQNTLAVMRLMDEARAAWGLKFPGENKLAI
ncbi:scyllo-inositol 2-dehydrogenase (NADP(+)) IolU [Sporomusa silvacetica DSM 10669]|uniref:Scyllo-inositol 2-dehydrogenase (NADP(+)) IolU n=1 Tax=Sporomusa silvacetica DSM 10669 TaxID=1123289 RepID=A0ABZ3ISF8_9FIRM|nr:Gfo/Idh/MocA family oxidoreductase [Sporomusa silvacetica]OZC14577.1 1,5-anhydro-D-fructose reductase [Sporomusa silvacetica DSM 10669]